MDIPPSTGVINPKLIKLGATTGQVPRPVADLSRQVVDGESGGVSPVEPVASSPAVLAPELASQAPDHVVADQNLLAPGQYGPFILDQYNRLFMVVRGQGNPRAYALDGDELRGLVVRDLRKRGSSVAPKIVNDVLQGLRAEAEMSAVRTNVWSRVAQCPDGSRVVALHDDANTQVVIRDGECKLLTAGSDVVFWRPPTADTMLVDAEHGDYQLLKKYLNLAADDFALFLGWVTYTLAHSKQPGNAFVILYLIGGQGVGKTFLSKVAIKVVDPNVIGVERLPKSGRELAIASQNSHLLAYDNLRVISLDLSDALCTLSSGGSTTSRRFYTNDEQHVVHLHGALVLNGIHSFVDQPDLAQRCLPLRMNRMEENKRESEQELWRRFNGELPVIQRGLFDLVARILKCLPEAKVTNPQRMFDFCRWLAAMEVALGIPAGIYQTSYAYALNEGQLDSLRESMLGSAILDFARQLSGRQWSGTPQELLSALNNFMSFGVQRLPRGWPDNPIALSKRLPPLETALRSQGVEIRSERRKERNLTITFHGD